MPFPNWLKALMLLAAAHSAPWVAARLLGSKLAAPIDAGMTFVDGKRLVGDHKTWRGVIATTLICAVVAPLLGYSLGIGLAFAALAVTGDVVASLIKRRLSLAPGTEVPGLDQIPEALAPLLVLAAALGIGVSTALMLTGVFCLLDLAALPLRHDH